MAKILDDFLVIIPAYNESNGLEDVIKKLAKYFKNILIIDDGSKDETLKIITNKKIKYLNHIINLGQGASLDTGFKYFLQKTNYKYAVTFDADGQHSEEDAYKMSRLIKSKNYNAVLGSRFLKKNKKKIPFLKFLILKLAIIYEKIFFSSNLSDAHNGLRVLDREIIELITPLKNHDMGHATEISSKICKSGLNYCEFSNIISYRGKKSQSILNSINIILNEILD